jgi:ribosomal protein S18 acetylase RimI-like enzyme
MDSANIRRARKEDIPSIVRYNLAMAQETEDKILDRATLTRGVESILANDRYGFYVMAEVNAQPVGQLMITYEWSDWRNGLFWWIQSVYVAPEFRGKGIYRELYQFVFLQAKADASICGIRLYVDKNNVHAKKVYERCGMREAHYDMFEVDFVIGK